MAQVYPGGESMAPCLVSLIGRKGALVDVTDLDAVRAELETALAAVDEKLKALKVRADERAHFREEVQHYKDKLSKLEGRPDPQSVQRMEENKVKLADMEAKFQGTNDALTPELMSLDNELARITTEVFRKFMNTSITHAFAVNEQINQGLAGVPAPVAVAPEAAPVVEAPPA